MAVDFYAADTDNITKDINNGKTNKRDTDIIWQGFG